MPKGQVDDAVRQALAAAVRAEREADVAEILARCKRDAGGCLLWTLALQGSKEAGHSPRLRIMGRSVNPRRVLWEHANGARLGRRVLRMTCADPERCVEPEHARCLSVAALRALDGRAGRYAHGVSWRLAIALSRRNRIPTATREQIRARLAAGETGRKVAEDLGISESSVSRIKLRQATADRARSVFDV